MDINLEWREQKSELWEGVTYEIRPLRVWAFQEIMTFWENNGGKAGASPAKSLNLMPVAQRIFKDHVRELKGVRVNIEGESTAATPDDLCRETPLVGLAGEIIVYLVTISEV